MRPATVTRTCPPEPVVGQGVTDRGHEHALVEGQVNRRDPAGLHVDCVPEAPPSWQRAVECLKPARGCCVDGMVRPSGRYG